MLNLSCASASMETGERLSILAYKVCIQWRVLRVPVSVCSVLLVQPANATPVLISWRDGQGYLVLVPHPRICQTYTYVGRVFLPAFFLSLVLFPLQWYWIHLSLEQGRPPLIYSTIFSIVTAACL